MAKKVESYTDVAYENDSRKMMEHIINNNAKQKAEEEDSRQKQMEYREKVRLNSLGQYSLRCVADVLIFVALFVALKADLIASAIVIPATYLCAIRFGWCWSKVVCLAKKGRGNK